MDEESVSPSAPSPSLLRPRRPTRDLPPSPINVDGVQTSPNGDAERSVHSAQAVSSPVEEQEETQLTPLRAHYLKKSLISLQFGIELDAISTASSVPNVSTLSYLGPPFTPPPRGVQPLDLPFLRYTFRQFVMTFPFLAPAPKNFFPEKLQPFVASLLSRGLSKANVMDDNSEDADQAAREKVLSKVEKQLALMLGSATKLVEPEEVVRLTQADLNRLEAIARKRKAKASKNQTVFEVNVVCIRAVVDKGRVRSKVHEEFIIRTRRTGFPDIYVSRRYGDFRSLAEELRKRHPDEVVRPPPPKDRSTVSASTSAPTAVATSPTASRMPNSLSSQSNNSSESIVSFTTQQAIQNIRLAREKNRLTLRAYLNSLLSNSALASSPVLLHFLSSNFTQLSRDEQEDALRREEADRKRDEGRIQFAHEIAARVEGLRLAIKGVKGEIMTRDGLTQIFSIVRMTESVRDLPTEYQAVLEWGRITLASTIFQHFVAADDASDSFATLKRLHGLMPYFMLKGILRISNPVAMIRGFLDLFLAQPFGGRSLLQRMFTSSLQEDVKTLEDEIEAVKEKVEDDMMCEKIRQFVYAPKEIQSVYKADAATEGLNLLTVVLRSGEQPALSRPQMHRVMRAHRAHMQYLQHLSELPDSDDDDGPQDDDAWLYEDLTILSKLYSQLRDKEQLIELIFEGTTADLLKDIITIFYAPLAQVYKAASIADSIGDLQNFINDLIRTVESVEAASQENPQHVVQAFIDLVERHEQAFYNFVHKVHSKGEGLFDGLMKWVQLFLTIFREGFTEKISLEYLLPHSGPERIAVMKEVDEVALYHYKLKLAHEDKLRRRFGKTQGQSEADAEDEATQMLVNGVVHDLSFGELLKGDADDMEAAESEESSASETDEDGSEDSSDYETATQSGSEESGEKGGEMGGPPPLPPKPAIRASMDGQSSPSLVSRQDQHAQRSSRRQTASVHSERRGRDAARENGSSRPRSRSRSLVALKSMFTKNNQDVPPVPPLPSHIPLSPLSKPLPPSPLSERSSQDSERPRKRTPPLKVSSRRKRNKAALELKPPELKEIPKILPIFVELMRPLLRPSAI
ncbi:hypothetical protein M0805_007423 [Coniferiporia weirii]|nr:hypothetical protein M0805_007423 [Coniferiporia weirii]